MGKNVISLLLVFALAFIVSCSGGKGGVVTPPIGDEPVVAGSTGGVCLGFWQVVINENGNVELTDLRSAELVVNVLCFLEPPPMKNLKVKLGTLIIDPVHQRMEVDVVLTHPLPIPRYRGFDVRGVVFGPRVANADGLTVIPSPEFFTGVPFGYQDGLLGTPDSVANYEGLAGYKYFCDGIGENDILSDFMSVPANVANRGVFSHGGTKITRHYTLEWAKVPQDFLVFNYGIYANYDNPMPPPPITLDSFPITTANSQEAFCFSATESDNTLYFNTSTGLGGGNIDLQIEVWDWQDNIQDVTVESLDPGVMPQTSYTSFLGDGGTDYSYIYGFDGVTASPVTAGELDLLVTVTDEKTFGESWYGGLLSSGNPLYGEYIYNCFIYTTQVALIGGPSDVFPLPYEDPMDTTTEDRWSVEKYWGDHLAPNADWYQEGTQWVCNDPATGLYEDNVFTWLVSPDIEISDKGVMYAEITFRYDVEQDWDNVHVGLDLVGDGDTWTFFTDLAGDPISGYLSGQNPEWPSYQVTEWYFLKDLVPGQTVKLGFIQVTDDTNSDYEGCFVDHVLLTDVVPQIPPIVGSVLGPATITQLDTYQYSVVVVEPNGDNVSYEWEVGDDSPAAYDDGPGNGDGTVDIDWSLYGIGTYTVDCRVTDDGSPPMNATSSDPLTVVVFDLPDNPGPHEDFEGIWPPSGWTFNDYTVAGTGEFWGRTYASATGTYCLDTDGADDSCYGSDLFEEARWENVTVPSSGFALLKITHSIWSEGYQTDMDFYDGGMLFIDDTLINELNFYAGEPNEYFHGSELYWTPNTYLPSWPGDLLHYGWAGRFPDPDNWLIGFSETYMDISSYADGSPHNFSFVFHSDDLYSCEEGDDYHSWCIDKVEIFYE
jgi:hypothetical protein